MKSTLPVWLLVGAVLGGMAVPLHRASSSYYTQRPEDAKAVYLTRNDSSVRGDGVGDDSEHPAGNQQRPRKRLGREFSSFRRAATALSKTLFVWPGIRLIGYGAHRPVFVLGKNTPGYQEGMGYMVMFTGGRSYQWSHAESPGRPARPVVGIVPPNDKIPDANPGTFYSAMSNIDFDIEDGKFGRCRDSIPRRPTLLPGSHGLPYRYSVGCTARCGQ